MFDRLASAPWTHTIIAILGIFVAAIRTTRGELESRQVGLGNTGEKSVAESLDELKARGYRVFHDLEGDGFNIDHVTVDPASVIVIETKAQTKSGDPDAQVTFDGERVLVNGFASDRDPVA